mmetsp:Transcript_29172/g.48999  ORF Transcript_29172/g.48999 Transcript_29172/m.48999 type:complete len:179 (+) Transcript_29172:21-557(+)
MEISPILPPSDALIDFDMLDCAVRGPEVSIIEDKELNASDPPSVIELIGPDSRVTFFADCTRPYMVLNFKGIDRFLTILIVCVDDTGEQKNIHVTNKSSFITADRSNIKAPLEIEDGWQFVCIDLEDFLANAFGATYAMCKEVTVCGSCRLSKLYFQSQHYSDVELPKFLRVFGTEDN